MAEVSARLRFGEEIMRRAGAPQLGQSIASGRAFIE
jgi:hypothetical protein